MREPSARSQKCVFFARLSTPQTHCPCQRSLPAPASRPGTYAWLQVGSTDRICTKRLKTSAPDPTQQNIKTSPFTGLDGIIHDGWRPHEHSEKDNKINISDLKHGISIKFEICHVIFSCGRPTDGHDLRIHGRRRLLAGFHAQFPTQDLARW